MLTDLNNVQQTDISDIHKHCMLLEIPYLILPWWWVTWTTFRILESKLLNAIFLKGFLFWKLIIRKIICYPPQRAERLVFCTVTVSKFMNCYSTTIGKDFLLWLLAVTSSEAKMLPIKVILTSLGVFRCLVLPTTNGKGFLYFASKCKQVYSLLIHHYWQNAFALDCCSINSNEVKMLPLKMGLPSLGVAFSQVRYSLVRYPYHQEYS